MTDEAKKPKAPQGRKMYERQPLEFYSLKEGEEISGIYLGSYKGKFAKIHKIQRDDGLIVGLNGRDSMDSTIAEIEALGTFFEDGMVGHYVIISRGENVETKRGRLAGVYEIGHDFDNCPKKCQAPQEPPNNPLPPAENPHQS